MPLSRLGLGFLLAKLIPSALCVHQAKLGASKGLTLQFYCLIKSYNQNFKRSIYDNKFYFFAIYFTLGLTCSFPSWSVTTKITRLLLGVEF